MTEDRKEFLVKFIIISAVSFAFMSLCVVFAHCIIQGRPYTGFWHTGVPLVRIPVAIWFGFSITNIIHKPKKRFAYDEETNSYEETGKKKTEKPLRPYPEQGPEEGKLFVRDNADNRAALATAGVPVAKFDYPDQAYIEYNIADRTWHGTPSFQWLYANPPFNLVDVDAIIKKHKATA